MSEHQQGATTGEALADNVSPQELRRRAEERLRLSRAQITDMTPGDVAELIHDLQVHQIELEMRNEDLLQVQMELADAHDRYLDLYEYAPVGYLTVDERFVVQQANLTAATMLGLERGKLVNTPLLKFVAPEEHDACFVHLRTALNRGSDFNGEGWFVRQDGSRFYARMQSGKIDGTRSTSVGLRITLTNISLQKRAELKLCESEARYRFLYEESHTVNLVIGIDGLIVDANRQALHNFGYRKDEVVGQPLLNFVVSEERASMQQRLAAVHQDGVRDVIDMRIYAKDGTIRTLMIVPGTVLCGDDGKPYGSIFSAADITERKQMELDLEKAHHKLGLLMNQKHGELKDTLQWLVVEKDQRKEVEGQLSQRRQALEAVYAMATVLSISEESLFDQVALAVADIIGVPFVAVLRKSGSDDRDIVSAVSHGTLMHAHEATSSCQLFGHLSATKLAYQTDDSPGESCGLCGRLAGDGHFESYIGVPLLDSDGNMYGAICCLDARRRTFNEFEEHLIEIFARYIANRISQGLMQKQLSDSQEMKILGQLTSGVAHEVRNPLNGIMAIVQALFKENGENPAFEPYKKHLDTQITRLTTLMDDLLSLGRPAREYTLKDMDVGDLLHEADAACRHAATFGSDSVVFSVPQEADAWRIRADAFKMQQVMVNLLENSRQHSPPGVVVRVIADTIDERAVRIRIVDNGPGIAPEHCSRIFEPFFTTRKAGTGLGLCIVRHIVRSHGGEVKLYNNEPGPGLTVEILLPLVA